MSLKTAGFDTHFWGPDGRAYSENKEAAIPADKAHAFNSILLEMLAGNRFKNPSQEQIKEAEQAWVARSKSKIADLIKGFPLRDRYKMVLEAMKKSGIKNLPASTTGLAVVFYDNTSKKDSIASFSINTGNQKTGPTSATNATQSSCPNNTNNKSGYRCPLLGSGRYAEGGGGQVHVTLALNKAAGFNSKKDDSSTVSPGKIAQAEASCLNAGYLTWQAIGINNGLRLHVVGDCVTIKAAEIVSQAVEAYVNPAGLQGIGAKSDTHRKNVWNYTHGWRDVPRSAWSPQISVLASCDRIEDLDLAHEQGYGTCVVVPTYVQNEAGKYMGSGIKLKNGWTLLPCPYEVGMMNAQKERVWCIECGLCLKDSFLRKHKMSVAFAAHTSGAQQISKQLVQIEELRR